MKELKSKLVYRPLPSDDPKRRKPDITLAKELSGWEPKVALKEGLARTIEYFRGFGRFRRFGKFRWLQLRDLKR